MPPCEYVRLMFGGTDRVAKVLGISKQAVHFWRANGRVPERHIPTILQVAKERGMDITLSDLVSGRALSK